MRLPALTPKDIRDILIIFAAVTLLTVFHFIVTDFPLFPETQKLIEDDKAYTIINPGAAQPVNYEMFRRLAEMDSTLLVDTRSREVYREGHIPGALNIPYEKGDTYLSRFEQKSDIRRVITYCDGDECMSSVDLAEKLVFIFPEVYYFFGGWEVWIDKNNPVEEGEGKAL